MVTVTVPVLRDDWRARLGQFVRSPALYACGLGLGVAIASQYIPDQYHHGLHHRSVVWTIGMGIIIVSSYQMIR